MGVGISEGNKEGPQAPWVADYDLARYPGKVHHDGVAALIDTIMNAPQPITLICIGPVPNIRAALERQPEIAKRARFVGMHGSVRKGYDGGPEPHREWNVVADAKAAQRAFTAEWPMLITPLDTCGIVRLRGDKYRRVAECSDPLTKAVIENYRIWSNAGDKPLDAIERAVRHGRHLPVVLDRPGEHRATADPRDRRRLYPHRPAGQADGLRDVVERSGRSLRTFGGQAHRQPIRTVEKFASTMLSRLAGGWTIRRTWNRV